jgi:hypothetical protein
MVNAGTVTDYKLNAVDGVLVRISGTVPAWEYEANYPLFAPYGVPTVVWPKGRQNVEVTYDHGYDEALLPRDIRLVALTIAARIVGQGLALEEQVGTTKVTYAAASTDVTNGEKMILQKYRRSR